MDKPIYLDYAATTPMDPRAAEQMVACLTQEGDFGNPASNTHCYGWRAEELVENARREVAKLIHADRREIVWTSGATEANNLAIKGVAYFYQDKGRHIITVKTEHKAVLDTCQFLETQGFRVTYLTPQADGRIDLNELEEAICSETLLISVMHVNNEIGIVQDIETIAALAKSHQIFFHVDAVQSVGKLPIDLSLLPIDLLSVSGHKLYGPKGIGALFVRRKPKVRLQALIHGGKHEGGMRSGTLPTHQIVGMGAAYEIARLEMATEIPTIKQQRQRLLQSLLALPGVQLNGSIEHGAPHVVNVAFAGVEGEALVMALKHLAVSTGSACNSASIQSSHVLKAIGLSDEMAHSSIRLSMGRFTTEAEIDQAIKEISEQVARLRQLSPLWTVT